MAIKASGALSMQNDIVDEFGGTAPHAMSEYYRGGSNVPDIASNTGIGASGLIRFGGFYNCINEILQALSNSTNVDLSSIFGSDWTSTTPKRCTIASGVTIGGTGGTAAITIPSNMGGTLSIVITGSVIGTGGSAGGAGGNAISNAASGVTLIIQSGGLCAGGGGGGGQGGTGGGGSYTTTGNQSRSYSSSNYYIYDTANSITWVKWDNVLVKNGGFGDWVSYAQGKNWYPYGYASGTVRNYGVTTSVTTTHNTNGGAGGSGGVGQGYNQTNASGSAGAGGGTNAGAGGTGGSGSTYGLAGGTGGTGANGNASNGSAGSAGGAAGAAVSGTALAAYTNNGTVNGTVST